MTAFAHLIGHVGTKKTKPLDNGGFCTTISIATKNKFKDSKGLKHEVTNWHYVNFFARLAEVVDKYVEVGDMLYVQGEIRTKKLEGHEEDDKGRWIYSVTGSQIKFLKSKNDKNLPPTEMYG